MNENTAMSAQDRLERLEQETERLAARLKRASGQFDFLCWLLIIAAAAAGGGLYYLYKTDAIRIEGLSPPVASKLETREFGLYNRQGDRVLFGTQDKFGNPELIFLDTNKRGCMRVKVWPDFNGTPGLVFSDRRGLRGILRIDPEGASVLNLVGKEQKGGITLSVTEDGIPSIKIEDKAGKVIWQAPGESK